MKIGIICHPSIGGSGLVATMLGIGLAKKGYEVHFISRAMPFRLQKRHKNIFFHPVEPISYPLFNDTLYTFALTSKIIEVAQRYEIDIMHAHYSIPHSLCAHLASQISTKKFKTITTIHGTDTKVVGQDKPLYPLNRFSLLKSDMLTTVSNYQKNYTITYFNLDKEIKVIHNFIDTKMFTHKNKSSKIRETLASKNQKIIMHISNFRKPKNTKGVIKAFYKTIGKIDAKLVLIGDGPDKEKIKNMCKKLGIKDRVLFYGKSNNVEKLLPNADCVLQPSLNESFGMVMLEAMSCRVPVVASDVDGIPEVLVHGNCGYMCSPDDYDSMAKFLIKICKDEKTAKKAWERG